MAKKRGTKQIALQYRGYTGKADYRQIDALTPRFGELQNGTVNHHDALIWHRRTTDPPFVEINTHVT